MLLGVFNQLKSRFKQVFLQCWNSISKVTFQKKRQRSKKRKTIKSTKQIYLLYYIVPTVTSFVSKLFSSWKKAYSSDFVLLNYLKIQKIVR